MKYIRDGFCSSHIRNCESIDVQSFCKEVNLSPQEITKEIAINLGIEYPVIYCIKSSVMYSNMTYDGYKWPAIVLFKEYDSDNYFRYIDYHYYTVHDGNLLPVLMIDSIGLSLKEYSIYESMNMLLDKNVAITLGIEGYLEELNEVEEEPHYIIGVVDNRHIITKRYVDKDDNWYYYIPVTINISKFTCVLMEHIKQVTIDMCAEKFKNKIAELFL